MSEILIVGIGGFLGAVSRFKLGGWVLRHSTGWRFPLNTFVINILGCFIAGILAGLIEKHDLFSANTRLFLFVGILGGFTTFSAFGLETILLLRRGDVGIAAANVVLSIAAAILVLWVGFRTSAWLRP